MVDDLKSVNKAFTKQSTGYDENDHSNQILGWMRHMVRKHVLDYLKKNDHLLELNAGTGLDAMYFIEQGCTVHATDLSDGMVAQIRQKAEKYKLGEKLAVAQSSYTNLSSLGNKKFDYIFSNFGGLNCIPDLKSVTKDLPQLLNKKGMVTFVIMPPVCPWEIVMVLKGNIKHAFRRFKKNGTLAHLEGQYFPTFYFTPSQVIRDFGEDFKLIKLEGLASLSPPPHFDQFPVRFPRIYKFLTALDEKISTWFFFRSCADHFIITLQYCPKE